MTGSVVHGNYEYSNPQPDMYLKTHAPHVCKGRPCCIHEPSDHHMRHWPLVHRTDEAILIPVSMRGVTMALGVESPIVMRSLVRSDRVCAHDLPHPDPDSVAWLYTQMANHPWEDHTCDGCCTPEPEEEFLV